MKNKTQKSGFSLVEMLVVVLVFSILSILIIQSLVLVLRGSRKSESLSIVKGNVDYAMSSIERLLRNAQDLNCALSTGSRLVYTDEYGNTGTYFSCEELGSDAFIASSSASIRLTSPDVRITNCSTVFTCIDGNGTPDSLEITVSADSVNFTGAEDSVITSKTRLILRSY